MSRSDRKFIRELRAAGASEQEIAELTNAALRLSSVKIPGMSAAARARVASRLPVDVDIEPSRLSHLPAMSLRWSAAATFAAIAIVVTAVLLPGMHQPDAQDAPKIISNLSHTSVHTAQRSLGNIIRESSNPKHQSL